MQFRAQVKESSALKCMFILNVWHVFAIPQKMGNLFSSCFLKRHRISSLREITLLMIGLDNAGKTCTAKHLVGESTSDAVPTVGFSSVQVKHGKYQVTIYDLGGGPKIRGIWKNYYALIHGIIFVVDASDPHRLEECKKEMINVLKDERIAGKPMLLLVNKQDVEGAIDETELVSQINLEAVVNEQKCPTRVEATCAIRDETKAKDTGIKEGFKWLIGHINKDFQILHERVQNEMAQQKEREEKERIERMERVRILREERKRLEGENEGTDEKNEMDYDDNDDVVVGNPFKPVRVIKEEIEKEAMSKGKTANLPPGAKVIHVSPTHSVYSTKDSIPNNHQGGIMYSPLSACKLKNTQFTSVDTDNEILNGSIKSSCLPPLSKEVGEEKKKLKKAKKRFKNRIVPGDVETHKHGGTRPGELPPLKAGSDSRLNGHADAFLSPCKLRLENEKINWALAEELLPVQETHALEEFARHSKMKTNITH